MAHRPRSEMIAETRAKLIAAARKAFAEKGYAAASMDDFTAEAGLTRGALYHHFGDKKGLLLAVIMQIDQEMNARLSAISGRATSSWQAFMDENLGYLEMALDPEIQRIVLREGPAVLGDPSQWPSATACINSIANNLQRLKAEGVVGDVDAQSTALLVTGASTYAAQWIAAADDPNAALERMKAGFKAMLEGLRASRAA